MALATRAVIQPATSWLSTTAPTAVAMPTMPAVAMTRIDARSTVVPRRALAGTMPWGRCPGVSGTGSLRIGCIVTFSTWERLSPTRIPGRANPSGASTERSARPRWAGRDRTSRSGAGPDIVAGTRRGAWSRQDASGDRNELGRRFLPAKEERRPARMLRHGGVLPDGRRHQFRPGLAGPDQPSAAASSAFVMCE
jgi:hypothetical protein